MPDITLSNEDLDLAISILATGPAVRGSRTISSKLQQAWIVQTAEPWAGEGEPPVPTPGAPYPVPLSDEEAQVAHEVIKASNEPGAEALAAQFAPAVSEPETETETDPDLDPDLDAKRGN